MTNTALNRTTILQLTNKSGTDVLQGDVVVIDSANASSFTTTTTSGITTSTVGVILEPFGIANNSIGGVATGGWVPKVNLISTAAIGDPIKTSSTAKRGMIATDGDAGIFAQTLETGTSPRAVISAVSSAAPTYTNLLVKEVILNEITTSGVSRFDINITESYKQINISFMARFGAGTASAFRIYLNDDLVNTNYDSLEIYMGDQNAANGATSDVSADYTTVVPYESVDVAWDDISSTRLSWADIKIPFPSASGINKQIWATDYIGVKPTDPDYPYYYKQEVFITWSGTDSITKLSLIPNNGSSTFQVGSQLLVTGDKVRSVSVGN